MGTLYIVLIFLCRVVQNIFNKKASGLQKDTSIVVKFAAYRQILAAVFALILVFIAEKNFITDWFTVLCATLSGFMILTAMTCSLLAMQQGTLALASLFSVGGVIIPCLAGIFLFNAPMQPMQWLGLVLFLCSAWLMAASSQKTYGKITAKTFVLLLLLLLSEGFTMVAQQMFMFYRPSGNVSMFSCLSFAIPGFVLAIVSLFFGKGNTTSEDKKSLAKTGIVLAAAVLMVNQLVTTATSFISPVILFSLSCGGAMIIALLVGRAVFKEKITIHSYIGIILGITALILIKIFE